MNNNLENYLNKKSYNNRRPSALIGNFDGDGRDEVIVTKDKNDKDLGNMIKKNYLLWIIGIPIIIGLILWLSKPNFVLERDENDEVIIGNIDWSKLILWTAIFSVGLYIILWVLKGVF
jgi:hypothetical protein